MNKLARISLVTLAGAAIVGVSFGTAAIAASRTEPVTKTIAQVSPDYRAALTTPCAEEDSSNCYWNAAERSNGYGQSFVNVNDKLFYFEGDFEVAPVEAVEAPAPIVGSNVAPNVGTEVVTVTEYVTEYVEVAGPVQTVYVVDQAAIDAAYAEGNIKADAAYQQGFEAGAAIADGRDQD